MENTNYKNKDVGKKILKIMQKNKFLKVRNSLLELEKYFIELKDVESKDREVKNKKETEELLFKPIIVSIYDMDRFEKKKWRK